jgi:hypothetical protein
VTFTVVTGPNIAIRETAYFNIEKQLIGRFCSVLHFCTGLVNEYGIIIPGVPSS